MRVVLDSSVLIAAAISRAGTCSAVLEDVLVHHELVLSTHILEEVDRKLRGKFGFPQREVRALRRLPVETGALVVPAELPGDACRDPNDIPVLGTVVAGAATALITEDKDLLELKHFRGIRIVGPGAFWALAHATAH